MQLACFDHGVVFDGVKAESDAVLRGDLIGLDPAGKTIRGARLDDRDRASGLKIWIVFAVKGEPQRLAAGMRLCPVQADRHSLHDRSEVPRESSIADARLKTRIP